MPLMRRRRTGGAEAREVIAPRLSRTRRGHADCTAQMTCIRQSITATARQPTPTSTVLHWLRSRSAHRITTGGMITALIREGQNSDGRDYHRADEVGPELVGVAGRRVADEWRDDRDDHLGDQEPADEGSPAEG